MHQGEAGEKERERASCGRSYSASQSFGLGWLTDLSERENVSSAESSRDIPMCSLAPPTE